jgi:hypothetical protein
MHTPNERLRTALRALSDLGEKVSQLIATGVHDLKKRDEYKDIVKRWNDFRNRH